MHFYDSLTTVFMNRRNEEVQTWGQVWLGHDWQPKFDCWPKMADYRIFQQHVEYQACAQSFRFFTQELGRVSISKKTKGCTVTQMSSTCYWWAAPKCDKHRNTMETKLLTISYGVVHARVWASYPYTWYFSLMPRLWQKTVRLRKLRQAPQ